MNKTEIKSESHTPRSEADIFDRLRAFRTPTIYDAIERFNVRSKNEGYTDGSIRCVLPTLGAFVGYAWTGKIVGAQPEAPGEASLSWRAVWESVAAAPRPSFAVVQDIDDKPGRGCAWGDVSVTIFKALGCVAALTNGCVRDLHDIEEIGFGLFAQGPTVGHAYVRFVDVGTPVSVGGMAVRSGDLIHADEHGATIIPASIDLEELLKIAAHVLAAEERVKRYCVSADFDVSRLDDLHTWSMETSG